MSYGAAWTSYQCSDQHLYRPTGVGAEGVEPSCSKAAGLSPLCLPISPRALAWTLWPTLSSLRLLAHWTQFRTQIRLDSAVTTAATQRTNPSAVPTVRGSLKEVSPGHWKLRVHDPATRRQAYKTVIATGQARGEPGLGRLRSRGARRQSQAEQEHRRLRPRRGPATSGPV